jgi:acetate kinase
MAYRHGMRLLTINSGSSSLKVALYEMAQTPARLLSGQAERIGLPTGRVGITDVAGTTLLERQGDLPDHDSALQVLFSWLAHERPDLVPQAAGHRIVHGGSDYREPRTITAALLATLRELVPIDPDHLPQAIRAIEAVSRAYPSIPQVACFDTAFHRHMPRLAQMYALPASFWDAGVRRYGFHGLSYEYIMDTLGTLDRAAAGGRVIIAHLGNGASMAAVQRGVGIDTTMGFSPTGGLVMSTRSGDLDPGVLLHALQSEGMDAAALNHLVNQRAGLLGVSGTSGDMHDLLNMVATDARAAEAVALFCYQAKKSLGALAAVLGGLDTLVFTGGIGEHAAPVRAGICAGLGFLGIALDPRRNGAHAPVISPDGGAVTVRVLHTDEELMIARHTSRLLQQEGTNDVSV